MSERACVEGWEDRMVIVLMFFSFNPLIFPFEEESHTFSVEEWLFENQ